MTPGRFEKPSYNPAPRCRTPLEKTLCLFGEELLEAKSNDLLLVFSSVVRKNGKAVAI